MLDQILLLDRIMRKQSKAGPTSWVRRAATFVVLVYSLTGVRAASSDSGLVGYWSTGLTERGVTLPVIFSFVRDASGGYSGRFSSESQAVLEYPLTSVTVSDQAIKFQLAGDSGGTTFSGTLAGDAITGRFVGDMGSGTFAAKRSNAPDFPYTSEDVRFKSGVVTLAGSLYVPKTRGRHPAVVLLHGSGFETRWGTNRFIADRLARRGVTALIYDQRGSGESGGDWRTVGYPALADDAIAAIRLLKARADIDPSEIGLWGHSQGGFISPLIASRTHDVAFIVAADSNASHTYEQDLFRVHNELRDSGWTGKTGEAAFALYSQFITVARTRQGYPELQAAMRRDEHESWFAWLGIPPRSSWLWSWYPLVANYDSRTYWKNVSVPVLLVYGQRDELSAIEPSIRAIESLVHGNGNASVEAIILPDAPHILHIAPGEHDQFFWWYMVPGYPDLIIDWIKRITDRID